MALLFATKIIQGGWDFVDVPTTWKEEVKDILIKKKKEELIK